jgi:hypothetical protein
MYDRIRVFALRGIFMLNVPSSAVVVPTVVFFTRILTPGRVSPVDASETLPETACCAAVLYENNTIKHKKRKYIRWGVYFRISEQVSSVQAKQR